jgi:DNA-binding transcriptional MocR family regulator
MAAQQPRWFSWFQGFIADGARHLSRSELLVMLVLAKFANSVTLEAWPSARTIAAMLGVNHTTVYRSLETLKSEGYITSRPETLPGKYRAYQVEVFSLVLPHVHGRTPSTVASEETGNSEYLSTNSQPLRNSEQEQVTLQEQIAARVTIRARTNDHGGTEKGQRQIPKTMSPEQLRRSVASKWESTNHGDNLHQWADIISRQLRHQGFDVSENDVMAALPLDSHV